MGSKTKTYVGGSDNAIEKNNGEGSGSIRGAGFSLNNVLRR